MRLVEDEKGTGSDKGEPMKAADILIAEVVAPVSPTSEETFDTACITTDFRTRAFGERRG
jgi:hypothetical protein